MTEELKESIDRIRELLSHDSKESNEIAESFLDGHSMEDQTKILRELMFR